MSFAGAASRARAGARSCGRRQRPAEEGQAAPLAGKVTFEDEAGQRAQLLLHPRPGTGIQNIATAYAPDGAGN